MPKRLKATIAQGIINHPLVAICVVALILVQPQIISQNMISGSDSVFHFNRFYDAAMQIKEGNWQYFISMYGFQSSGRIVNALYSPYFAYLQGGLLLLVKTWFNYQLLTNFLLYLLAGFSMYFFLKRLKVRVSLRFSIAIIYLSTFAVQYWITRQGFSSWGAALLPLCLLPIIPMIHQQDIPVFELGFLTALMFQIHFLSTLFLVMCYLPFFCWAMWHSPAKWRLLGKAVLSVAIFFVFSLNLWFSLAQVYLHNQILAPFVNHSMAEATITYSSFYCLLTPFFLIFIILLIMKLYVKKRKALTPFLKITMGTSLFFLVLASNLIPWNFLLEKQLKIVELLQFPFRLVIAATVLLLVALALLLNDYSFSELKHFKQSTMVVLAIIQTLLLQIVLLTTWAKPDNFIFSVINTYIADVPTAEVKAAFYDEDLSLALNYIQKSTPDYLPVYQEHEGTKYKLYKAQVLDLQANFEKRVVGDKLLVSWQGASRQQVTVPIIGYANTQLVLNHQQLTDQDIEHTQIGVLKLKQKVGENVLEVSYQTPNYLPLAIFTPPLLSVGYFLVWLVRRVRGSLKTVKAISA